MNPEVSVLVPIYNVSSYIERCAHSLFNQTFNNIEFIFINDGSTDNSIELLERVIDYYPIVKDKVVIIHHEFNKGLANARNTALNASRGKFVSIVDSDDFVEPDMIEALYNKAIEENADIVISDVYFELYSESILKTDNLSVDPENFFSDIIKNEGCYSFLCNKLIKRSLYLKEDCRVPSGLNFYEDRHVMTRLFFYAEKIVKVNKAFYHYVQYNDNAITKYKTRMHFQNMIDFWNLLGDFLKIKNLFEIYAPIMEYPKVQSKVGLMLDCNSYKLMKEYADLFIEEELKHIKKFKYGERIIMYFIRNHHFVLAAFFQKMLVLKNSVYFHNGKIKIHKMLFTRLFKFA